jgi:transposase
LSAKRATGSVAPGKMGGHRKWVLEPHRAFILERINQMPHLTLHRLKEELAVRGVKVSHNAVWLFLRHEGLRFKKTLLAVERARSDVARRRRRWQARQAASILGAWCSSTKTGSRPTWPCCADGDRR